MLHACPGARRIARCIASGLARLTGDIGGASAAAAVHDATAAGAVGTRGRGTFFEVLHSRGIDLLRNREKMISGRARDDACFFRDDNNGAWPEGPGRNDDGVAAREVVPCRLDRRPARPPRSTPHRVWIPFGRLGRSFPAWDEGPACGRASPRRGCAGA